MKKIIEDGIFITQEETAKNIGASREGVSRMLKRLEKENIIMISRKKIIIKDINKLKKSKKCD